MILLILLSNPPGTQCSINPGCRSPSQTPVWWRFCIKKRRFLVGNRGRQKKFSKVLASFTLTHYLWVRLRKNHNILCFSFFRPVVKIIS